MKPYADVIAFDAAAIQISEAQDVVFKKFKSPPAVDRGSCRMCGGPVVEFLSMPPMPKLAFVPSANFTRPSFLPSPSRHIFYHRRIADVADDVPKVSGFLRSQLCALGLVLRLLRR